MARARLDIDSPRALPRRSQGDLLVDALATWTATRSAALAEVVDTLTAAALADWAGPRTADAFQASWLRAVGDPVGRGWAIANLVDSLPGRDRIAQVAALAIRLRKLIGIGADPRIGHVVARHALAEHPLFGFAEITGLVEDLLFVCRDERVRALLAGAATDELDPVLAKMIERVLAKPPLGRAATRRELDRFATAAAPRGRAAADVDALLAQVFARPDDDEPRLVLADALQAQGDPRGELIALQLASGDDPTRLKRIDQLIKACGKDWLGEVAGIAYRAQFQRGFLAKLELAKSFSTGVSAFTELRGHPMLATIEELVPGDTYGGSYAALVTSPAMKSLRRIEVYDKDTIAGLEQTPHAVTHVACPRLKRGSGNYVRGLVERVFPACRAKRSVTSLGVQVEGFEALASSGLLDRVTSVTLGDNNLGEVLAVWKRLPATTTLVAKRYAALEECLALRVAWLGELTIARVDDELVGRAWGEWPISAVIEHLGRLPPLDRLIVQGATPEQADRLKRTGSRGKSKLKIEHQPAPIRSGYFTLGR